MISVVLVVVTYISCGQALPVLPNIINGQPGSLTKNVITDQDLEVSVRHRRQDNLGQDVVDEIEDAREEFIDELDTAMTELVAGVTGEYLEDTTEVKEAKQEFLGVFNQALNGFIKKVFIEDTADVKAAKEDFFKVFIDATNGLIKTVENFYIEDTEEVKAAKEKFNQGFKDAEAGIVGAQYIPYTPEVQAARDQFFRFFDLVVNGMLYKLAPKPVPIQYIQDTADVNNAKKNFLQLYRSALGGDFKSALTVVALEEAIKNNEGDSVQAADEFLQTATDLEEMIRILESGDSNKIQDFLTYNATDEESSDEETERSSEEDTEQSSEEEAENSSGEVSEQSSDRSEEDTEEYVSKVFNKFEENEENKAVETAAENKDAILDDLFEHNSESMNESVNDDNIESVNENVDFGALDAIADENLDKLEKDLDDVLEKLDDEEDYEYN